MLLNLLKKHSLDDRLNFWNNYIQRLIRWSFIMSF
jgi:hypothetical protein